MIGFILQNEQYAPKSKLGTMTETNVPLRANCYREECGARTILSHVASRWGSLVIALLSAGTTLRFSELRKRIGGVSEKMLAQTLRDLERDGLVSRRSYPVVPPRVEYTLTPLGEGISTHVLAMVDWINEHTMILATKVSEAELARS